MPGGVYLESDDLRLRTIEEDDLSFLRDTINDPAVRNTLARIGPYNLEQERQFFEEVISDDEHLNLLVWADGERAGTIGLQPTNPPLGSSEIGLFLAEDAWGRGLGTEAARLVTEHAFADRGHHRVTARVLEGNEASKRIWEKLGFRQEATMTEAAFHDGEYVDMHYFAVLAREWFEGRD